MCVSVPAAPVAPDYVERPDAEVVAVPGVVRAVLVAAYVFARGGGFAGAAGVDGPLAFHRVLGDAGLAVAFV